MAGSRVVVGLIRITAELMPIAAVLRRCHSCSEYNQAARLHVPQSTPQEAPANGLTLESGRTIFPVLWWPRRHDAAV